SCELINSDLYNIKVRNVGFRIVFVD
ncbi:hypothetical protein C5S29_09170, partial [ANME-1 cluster archaeon GoMg3.2]|nr:hypothetical protein [ANME-1 cluster archaeon GoMg3.2]